MNDDMVNMIIKALTINFLSLYIFFAIINEKIHTKIRFFVIFVFSIFITVSYCILSLYLEKITVLIFIFFIQLILIKIEIRNNDKSFLVENLLANAIEYSLYSVSCFIEIMPKSIFNIGNTHINFIFMSLINIFLCIKITNMKRVKNGISFLQERIENNYFKIIILNISSVVLLCYSLFGKYSGKVTEQILITFITIIVIMIIMIQKTLTLYYKQKLLHQTIEDYKNEISEKDKKIKELSDEKYKISKLNHEFYNRQKALEKKVSDFVCGSDTETAGEITAADKIASLSKEYSDKLQDIKHPDKLPSTDIEEIDDMFQYMQSECEKNKIEFKLQVNGNIHHMINKIIPKDKLVTLIGDHLRDAIIAINSSNNKFRSIFAIIGKTDLYYEFCVLDTGIEFEVATLLDLGTKPITTHKDTGGTGFGFMTTFETLKVTNGSLEIEEKHKMNENDYTKAVKIIFDDKSQYRIKSYRLGTKEKNI